MEVAVPGGAQEAAPGFWQQAGDQIGAAWNLDTTVGALDAFLDLDTEDPGATINQLADEELWSMLTEQERNMPELFADVLTPQQLARRRAEIQQKQDFEETLGEGPLPALLAGLVAQFGDPVNYIPIAGVGSKFVTGARSGLQAFGRGALTVGTSSAALTAGQEVFIHQMQAGRTIGESVTAVALTGALGAGLGGPLGTLARRGSLRREQFIGARNSVDDEFGGMLDDAARTADPDAVPLPQRVADEAIAEAPMAARAETPAEWADGYKALDEQGRIDLARRAETGEPPTPRDLYYMRRAADDFEGEAEAARVRIAELEADINKLEDLRDNAQDRGARQSYSQRMRRRREQLQTLRDKEVNAASMADTLRGTTDGGVAMIRAIGREVADTINDMAEAGKPTVNRAEVADELAQIEAKLAEVEARLEGRTETLGEGPRRDPKKMTVNQLFREEPAPDVNVAKDIELEGTGRNLSAGAAPKFVGSTNLRYTPNDTRMYAKNWLSRLAIAMHKKGDEQFGRFGAVLSAIPRRANLGLSNTGVQLFGSRFAHAREYAMRLAMVNVAQVGPEAGRAFQSAVPVEAMVRQRVQAYTIKSRAIFNENYRSYVQDVKAFNRKAKAEGQPTRPVRSPDEFAREVSRAVRRQDLDANAPQRNKFVSTAAGRYHKEFFQPLLDEMRNAGLLENLPVDADLGYLHRMYDRRAIRQNIDSFRKIVADHIGRMPGARAYTQDELAKITSKTVENILAPTTDIGFPSYRVVAERGPLATRELRIDDRFLDNAIIKDADGSQKTVSFLIDDINQIMDRYIRVSVSDLAMTKEFGSPNPLAQMLDNMKDESQRQIAEDLAAGRITKRQAERMKNEAEGEAQALTTVYERVRGTSLIPLNPAYDVPRRVLHQLRNWSSMRLLGMSGLSSIPDAGRLVLQQGMARTYGTAFREMMSGFRGIRMSAKDMRAMSVGLDLELSTTARRLSDAGTNLQSRTMVERIGDKGAEAMFLVNGQNLWNSKVKHLSAHMGGNEILDAAELVSRGERVSDVTRKRLARMGISEDDLEAIAQQRDPDKWRTTKDGVAPEFGWFEVDGAKILSLDTWPNRALAERVGQRLMMLADDVVITPGALDSPGWMDTMAGKMFGHIKKFMMAATARNTLVGMQRQDADALMGLLHFVALGAGVFYLRLAMSGRLETLEDMSVEEFALNAIDRSGAIPFFFEMDNAMGAFSGTYAQPTRLMTGEAPLRTSQSTAAKYIGGTVGSGVLDAVQTLNYLNQKDWEAEANDYRRLARLAPFSNLIGLSAILNSQLPAD